MKTYRSFVDNVNTIKENIDAVGIQKALDRLNADSERRTIRHQRAKASQESHRAFSIGLADQARKRQKSITNKNWES